MDRGAMDFIVGSKVCVVVPFWLFASQDVENQRADTHIMLVKSRVIR